MSGYVLRRDEDGKFVSPAGRRRSYVVALQNARVFPTRAAAESERCGNEEVLPLEDAMIHREKTR